MRQLMIISILCLTGLGARESLAETSETNETASPQQEPYASPPESDAEAPQQPSPEEEGEEPSSAESEPYAAQPEEGMQESADAEGEAPSSDAIDTPQPSPPVVGLPGPALDVAFTRSVNGLQPGDRLEPGRSVIIPDGGCLRLVAGTSAALSFRGPARAELAAREGRLVVNVTSGRGLLSADAQGGALEVAGHHVEVWAGTVAFTTDGQRQAAMVSGESGRIDGEQLPFGAPAEEATELLSAGFCAPPAPTLAFTLGDPAGLTEASAQARAQGGEGEGEAATAEGGATCVDSADSSAATDPNQSTDGGIDPDARRDEPGTLRLTIRLPR